MEYIDPIIIFFCIFLPVLAFINGFIKECFYFIYVILLYIFTPYFYKNHGWVGVIAFTVIFSILVSYISSKIKKRYYSKEGFSRLKDHFLGIIPGVFKLAFSIFIFIVVMDTLKLISPSIETDKISSYNNIKKYTSVIPYDIFAKKMYDYIFSFGSQSNSLNRDADNTDNVPAKKIDNIHDLSNSIKGNENFKLLLDDEVAMSIIKNPNKKPQDIIVLLKNDSFKRFIKDPEVLKVFKNADYKKIMSQIKELTEKK